MFPHKVKIKFPHYINSNSHYRLEEIQKDIEKMWSEAAEQESSLGLLVDCHKEKKGNLLRKAPSLEPKYVKDGIFDFTEAVEYMQEIVVEQILIAQGWIAFDWLRGIFLASLVSKLSNIYPVFWLSSELARAIEFTEPPEVDYKQIKWFTQCGIIILPKRFFISRNGKEIKAISFFSTTEEKQELFVSCIADDEILRGVGIDLQENKPRYKEKTVENVTNIICRANSLGRYAIDPSDLVKSEAIDTFLTSRSDSIKATNILIALNLICAQRSEYIDAEVLNSNKLGFGKGSSAIASKVTRWIGKHFSIKEQKITKKNLEDQKYLRSGHWRLQAYGSKNNQERRVIWIEPTWAFGQEGSGKRSSSFRTLVLRRYGSKCCLCDCSIEELIDAAHIIPFAFEGPDHPENGLPLCNSHHTAFDRKLFLISPLTTEIYPNRSYSLDQLQVQYMNLSHLINLPEKDFLRWRWNADKTSK